MIDRRLFLAGAAALSGSAIANARPRERGVGRRALDSAQSALRPGSPDDQTAALQKAIDQAAQHRTPLLLQPGTYRAAGLNLPTGVQIAGVRGVTRLVLSRNVPLLSAAHAETITLSGLTLDGGKIPLGEDAALVMLMDGHGVRVSDCEFNNAGGTALMCRDVEGQITGSAFTGALDTAIFSIDGRNMLIAGNSIRGSGNGGIRVWQSQKRADGAIIADNTIEDTAARAGGSGQNGNAINVYRAANVTVRGNRIRDAAFSAIRANAASQVQMLGNNCTGLGEVALYCEFDFENATITGNTVDGAGMGVSVTNFKEGGRLATVQGNVLRNITRHRPETDPGEGYGVGIGVEADTAVTGNVVENAAKIGILAGNGPYLRDVTVTGNVVRNTPYGIAVSVAQGAGAAVVSHNLVSGARRGAVVGMEWDKVVTADLVLVAPGAYPQLTVSANQIR